MLHHHFIILLITIVKTRRSGDGGGWGGYRKGKVAGRDGDWRLKARTGPDETHPYTVAGRRTGQRWRTTRPGCRRRAVRSRGAASFAARRGEGSEGGKRRAEREEGGGESVDEREILTVESEI